MQRWWLDKPREEALGALLEAAIQRKDPDWQLPQGYPLRFRTKEKKSNSDCSFLFEYTATKPWLALSGGADEHFAQRCTNAMTELGGALFDARVEWRNEQQWTCVTLSDLAWAK